MVLDTNQKRRGITINVYTITSKIISVTVYYFGELFKESRKLSILPMVGAYPMSQGNVLNIVLNIACTARQKQHNPKHREVVMWLRGLNISGWLAHL